jgi:endonuclease YncB( thermonuclease family)
VRPLRPPGFLIAAALVLAAAWVYVGQPGARRAAVERDTLVVNRAYLHRHGRRSAVIDGDTLVIDGEHIRLDGIDAPEREQVCRNSAGASYPCGLMAMARLRQVIDGTRLECVAHYRDIYRRRVASCTADGKDVSDAMVRSGWALDVALYSGGRYLAAETEARGAKRGLWAGDFEAPWRWRQQHAPRTAR